MNFDFSRTRSFSAMKREIFEEQVSHGPRSRHLDDESSLYEGVWKKVVEEWVARPHSEEPMRPAFGMTWRCACREEMGRGTWDLVPFASTAYFFTEASSSRIPEAQQLTVPKSSRRGRRSMRPAKAGHRCGSLKTVFFSKAASEG